MRAAASPSCHRRALRAGRAQRGFTIIELLVVIGILSVLAALVLPAVQSARAASRRTQCTSNLRNLAIAALAHETALGHLPRGSSWRIQILPYLDRGPLLEACESDFHAASGVVVPELVCPADSADVMLHNPDESAVPPFATANYAGCYASHPLIAGRDGALGSIPIPGDESNSFGVIRISQITKGLSNTAMLSEFLRANGTRSRLRAIWLNPTRFGPDDAEGLTRECDGVPPDAVSLGWFGDAYHKGYPWNRCDMGSGRYNHVLGPNRPSCYNNGDNPNGAYTASSGHAGGVNVAHADGHVEFVSEDVDLTVWRVLATRNRK